MTIIFMADNLILYYFPPNVSDKMLTAFLICFFRICPPRSAGLFAMISGKSPYCFFLYYLLYNIDIKNAECYNKADY